LRNSIIVLLVLLIFGGDVYAQSRPAAKKGKGKTKAVVAKKGGTPPAKEGAPKPKKENLWVHPGGNLLSTSFASAGKSTVSVNSEGDIFFWDVDSGNKIRTVRSGSKAVAAAFFGNKQIALGGGLDKDNAIFMQNLTTGKKTETLAGHKGGITTLAFSVDGESILSGGWNNQVVLWGVEHGDIVRVFKGHDAVVNAVAVSPDRVIAASGSADGKIKIWNMSTGELVQTIKAHKKGVSKVAFSPDGKLILSGGIEKGTGQDKKKDVYPIKLWDVATGKPLSKTNIGEHKVPLSIAIFSPNGNFALSSDRDGVMKLWDITAAGVVLPKGAPAPQNEVRTFEGHAGGISTASFSPDGTRVLAGGNGTLTLWETETGKVLGGGKTPPVEGVPPPETEKPNEPPAGGVPPVKG
jgi:WD40 repeat protein